MQKFKDDILSLPPQLNDEIKLQLELHITVEVTKATDLNNGMSPGSHTVSLHELTKCFKDKIGILLCQIFKEAYDREILPPSFLCSHTTLIPKTDDSIKLEQIWVTVQ